MYHCSSPFPSADCHPTNTESVYWKRLLQVSEAENFESLKVTETRIHKKVSWSKLQTVIRSGSSLSQHII